MLESCHVELHELLESLPILDGDIDVVSGQERIEVQPLYGGNPAPHRIGKLGLCRGHGQIRDVLPQLALASKLDRLRIRRSDFVHAVERRRRPADLEVVCGDGQAWVEPQTRGNLIGSRPLQPVLSCLQF